MLIKLKPRAPRDLGEIVIDDCLFAVGRHEAPFASLDPALTEKLSRRHARIFEQDGVVYLADLGSLNGTSVGGHPVGKEPVSVHRGDEICFAGLCYQAEIVDVTATRGEPGPASPPLRLILWPENPQVSLEPIVVTEFPFLINKASDVFARYKDQLPADVSYISRRHAHIFVRNNQLYIEDLGSTNGTYLDGVRLDEHARLLHDGKRVAFGGDQFAYRVALVYETGEATGAAANDGLSTQALRAGNDITKTTFVTSASSFLEIFCCEDEEAAPEVQAPEAAAAVEIGRPAGAQTARGWRGLYRRSRTLWREMRTSLADEPQAGTGRRRRPALVLLGVAALAAIGAGLWSRTTPEREISELMERAAYPEAAMRADEHLLSHPDDRDIVALGNEALLQATVPEWMAAIGSGRFADAEARVARSRGLVEHNAEGRALLELLAWTTGLERFFVERGGADAPVRMFDDEARIVALLDEWEPNATEQRHRLETLTRTVPAFGTLRAQLFSQVRTLRSLKALELKAIDRLAATVGATLEAGDPTTLTAVLNDFEMRYPRIGGVDKLRADLDRYLAVSAAREDEDWIKAYRLVHEGSFETPPFRNRIASLQASGLPSADFIAAYDGAVEAWRQGRLDEAITDLEKLAAGPWGEVARRQLERGRERQRQYADLVAAKQGAGYQDRLLEFYSGLDPAQDQYFAEVLAADIRKHSAIAFGKAEQSYAAARSIWQTYREGGGIRGMQRLEPSVSAGYRQLATGLSASYRHIGQSLRVCKLLNRQCPSEWHELHARITNEVMLQRRSLAELALVLEPALNKAKLDLLPVPPEPVAGADPASNGLP
ncbi:MAG: FHA domain-containing protein [Thiohalobacteraceae bacterium]